MHQTWRFVRALSASGLAMLFAACSNTGSPISITPPGAALAAHGRIAHSATRCCGEFVYVTNFGSHDISADTIEETRGGRLSPVAGQPFAAGTEPWGITIDPTGRFAYVATCASNNVSAFAVDDGSGALTPVTGSPFATLVCPHGVAVDPTGDFVYFPDEYSNAISAYAIDAESGALKPVRGSPYAAGTEPIGIATCQRVGNACEPDPFSTPSP